MTRTRLLVAVMALCLASAVHAQTDSTRIEQNVGYTTEALYAAYPDSMVRPDTTLGSFQRYDPLYHSGSFYGHLGQVGSPVYNLMFRPYNGVTFLLREDPYAPYLFTADRVRYHRLVSPYTDLFYVQGSKQEQVLEVVHSQQVMPTLNMAVRFRRINVPGFYSRQQAGHSSFAFSTWYRARSGKYSAFGAAVINKVVHLENGGLTSDTIFEQNLNASRNAYPVNLASAGSGERHNGFRIKQVVHFKGTPDSVRAENTCCRSDVFHAFSFDKSSFWYYDDAPASGYYNQVFLDSTRTMDSVHVEHMRNELGWEVGQAMAFRATFSHDQHTLRGPCGDTTLTDLALHAHAAWQPGKSRAEASLSYGLDGYNSDALQFAASFLTPLKGKYSLRVWADAGQHRPSWMMIQYAGNHQQWRHVRVDYNMEQQQGAGMQFIGAPGDTLGMRIRQVNGYLYYDAFAMPSQLTSGVTVWEAALQKKVNWRNINLEAQGVFQKEVGTDVLHLPQFLLRSSIYYENWLFSKALLARIGVDVTYHSGFYGRAWMPATGQFYLQWEREVGDYPYADVFIDLRIKRVRAFVMMQHINEGMLPYTYYLTPHHPMADRAFKLGLNWRFFD